MTEGDGGFQPSALERARAAAHLPGDDAGQESFMRAGEIRELAEHARIAPGTRVLDLCCGTGGPGRFLVGSTGCAYLGVDDSASAIRTARERARGLPCEYRIERVPPLPPGPFDVVLLLETMLAFADKRPLLRAVSGALAAGGRFACTFEAGVPLTPAERERMPAADTVWPVTVEAMRGMLTEAGLTVRWERDVTSGHREVAEALLRAYEQDASAISAEIGSRALDDLLTAHRTWVEWLGSGRVSKLLLVAEPLGQPPIAGAVAGPASHRNKSPDG
jgi:SAM-dependent methyltransferase